MMSRLLSKWSFFLVLACQAAAIEIYVDDIWLGTDGDIGLRAMDLRGDHDFDVEVLSNIIVDSWEPIFRYAFGYGYGYGYGYGFRYRAEFGYGYGYSYGYGYGYHPVLNWTGTYTNEADRLFYRIRKR